MIDNEITNVSEEVKNLCEQKQVLKEPLEEISTQNGPPKKN